MIEKIEKEKIDYEEKEKIMLNIINERKIEAGKKEIEILNLSAKINENLNILEEYKDLEADYQSLAAEWQELSNIEGTKEIREETEGRIKFLLKPLNPLPDWGINKINRIKHYWNEEINDKIEAECLFCKKVKKRLKFECKRCKKFSCYKCSSENYNTECAGEEKGSHKWMPEKEANLIHLCIICAKKKKVEGFCIKCKKKVCKDCLHKDPKGCG